MKKLLLITFLFLITPDAKADMDTVCAVLYDNAYSEIKERCVRNNILYMMSIPQRFRLQQSALWCRQDREINIIFSVESEVEKFFHLSCVLYDNKPREFIFEPE